MPKLPENRDKLERKTVMLGKKHIQYLNHFIEDGLHSNDSDAVRAALVYYHNKIYPNYIFHLSPAAKKKQKEYEVEEQEAAITDDEFAARIKFTPVYKTNGEKFYFFRGIGHSPQLVPADQLRALVEEKEYIIADNAKECAWESVKSYFSNSWGDVFCEKNDLLMPEFPDDEEE